MNTLECALCEQHKRTFNCVNCIKEGLHEHNVAFTELTTQRDTLIDAAAKILEQRAKARYLRADVSSLRYRVTDIQRHIASLRELNDNTRETLASRRSALATRREVLARAQRLEGQSRLDESRTPTPTPPGGPPSARRRSPPPQIQSEIDLLLMSCKPECETLQDVLARARQGLVHELIEVFDIVEVGGRPSIGARAGARGEWAIAGLVLPVPGDVRRYPPQEINAVVTLTIHFLGLLTYYLGVKLPFEILWNGGKLGVGEPYIYAGKGTDSGGWARWTVKNPLHLALSPATSSPPASSPASPTSGLPSSSRAVIAPSGMPRSRTLSTSDSQADLTAEGEGSQPPASFTTAFAMLIYNVAYLAHTQSVEIPLSQTGEVLRNLWAICCSAELGRRSHETRPLLPPPTPSSFRLDFKQLLQATTADPASRTRPRSHRSSTAASANVTSRTRKRHERISEEDEWDLMEDAL